MRSGPIRSHHRETRCPVLPGRLAASHHYHDPMQAPTKRLLTQPKSPDERLSEPTLLLNGQTGGVFLENLDDLCQAALLGMNERGLAFGVGRGRVGSGDTLCAAPDARSRVGARAAGREPADAQPAGRERRTGRLDSPRPGRARRQRAASVRHDLFALPACGPSAAATTRASLPAHRSPAACCGCGCLCPAGLRVPGREPRARRSAPVGRGAWRTGR